MADPQPSAPRPRWSQSFVWGTALLGGLLALSSLALYVIQHVWMVGHQVSLALGAILLLSAVLMRPCAVKTALTGRSAHYGSNAVIVTVAFIGILGFVNFLSHKYEIEFDLTETGLFTLSEQTISVLQNLDTPVQVLGFYKAGDPRLNRARELLERYSHYTGYLTYEFHDPNREPALARSLELENYGLVFVSGKNRYQTTGADEQSLTAGILRVTHSRQKTVYFLTGHGEHSVDDGGEDGYSAVKQALENQNYVVKTLHLAAEAIPDDASLLILAGSDRDLLDDETRQIIAWMAGGGRLMMLVDPVKPVPLQPLLQEYGLALPDNFVVEDMNNALVALGPRGLTPHLITPLITHYPYHEITRGLNGIQSFFPFSRSIEITPVNDTALKVSPLLTTSPGSWAETETQIAEPEFTRGVDVVGPFHIGVAAENTRTNARLVVFGDAGFVSNRNVSPHVANLGLFVNAVNWLTEEEALISIRPRPPKDRRLLLTAAQMNLILAVSVVLLPLSVFAVGIVVWWIRQ